jgi:hypothetical protein
MEVSSELHILVALPSGKEPPGTHWRRGLVVPRFGLEVLEEIKIFHSRETSPLLLIQHFLRCPPYLEDVFIHYFRKQRALCKKKSLTHQPPFQGVPAVKRPGHEARHSPPSSAEVKRSGAIPPLCHMSYGTVLKKCKPRDNFSSHEWGKQKKLK